MTFHFHKNVDWLQILLFFQVTARLLKPYSIKLFYKGEFGGKSVTVNELMYIRYVTYPNLKSIPHYGKNQPFAYKNDFKVDNRWSISVNQQK